jgi:hypothetical protein
VSFDLKIRKGDIAIAADGRLDIVSDNNKLRQDIVKILLTKLGENKYHPTYGSEVGALQIGHVPDQALLELDLSSSAEASVRKLIVLQRSQAKRQFLTPGETIVSILDVSVSRDTVDPRMYNIFVSVQTQRLTSLTEVITVRIL